MGDHITERNLSEGDPNEIEWSPEKRQRDGQHVMDLWNLWNACETVLGRVFEAEDQFYGDRYTQTRIVWQDRAKQVWDEWRTAATAYQDF